MQGKKVSKPIVRISIISIALAVIVNLITIAVVTGFQQEVRQKITGFGAPIFIMSASENSVYESEAIHTDQSFLKDLALDSDIEAVYGVGYKPVLFQSERTEIHYTLPNGKDTSEINQQVNGAIIKGVDSTYNLDFFKTHLTEGKLPNYASSSSNQHILISRKLANDLSYNVNDTVSAFFVKNRPIKRKFIIIGIYDTGLEEFDKKTVLAKLSIVQELNDWGIKASIELADTMLNGQLIIGANVIGGNGHHRYNWGLGYETYARFTHCPIKDTTFQLIASDYWSNIEGRNEVNAIPDTAYLKITVEGTGFSPCDFEHNELGELKRNYLADDGSKFSIQAGHKNIIFEFIEGRGSAHNYVGGFEVMIKDWEQLDAVVNRTSNRIDLAPTKYNELLKTTSIRENQHDIFVWLEFLDINVVIILTLMILIGIINMGSALLVLILIRSNFIGMMKAMGATNWSIRKIFLIQVSFLISRGMIWGNIIGVGLCFMQSYFGIFTLNPEVYYLTEVPIELSLLNWALLNVVTLLVCITALIIPSVVITRIKPVNAIKFN